MELSMILSLFDDPLGLFEGSRWIFALLGFWNILSANCIIQKPATKIKLNQWISLASGLQACNMVQTSVWRLSLYGVYALVFIAN